jgi:hypothetical protein
MKFKALIIKIKQIMLIYNMLKIKKKNRVLSTLEEGLLPHSKIIYQGTSALQKIWRPQI